MMVDVMMEFRWDANVHPRANVIIRYPRPQQMQFESPVHHIHPNMSLDDWILRVDIETPSTDQNLAGNFFNVDNKFVAKDHLCAATLASCKACVKKREQKRIEHHTRYHLKENRNLEIGTICFKKGIDAVRHTITNSRRRL